MLNFEEINVCKRHSNTYLQLTEYRNLNVKSISLRAETNKNKTFFSQTGSSYLLNHSEKVFFSGSGFLIPHPP